MTERPRIAPDSPLQDWKLIRMLAAMGTPLEVSVADATIPHSWSTAPEWSDREWWDLWNGLAAHRLWSFRRKS